MKNTNKVICELCTEPANTYCDSDRASLCWRCDHKVHGANFLVAKHNRSVLCHHCQRFTPWAASGPTLPPSMSLCLACITSHNFTTQVSLQSQVNNNDYEDADEDDEESVSYEDDYGSDDEEDEDEGENQVVPLTLDNGATPLNIVTSEEIEEEEDDSNSSRLLTALPTNPLKRRREIFDSD